MSKFVLKQKNDKWSFDVISVDGNVSFRSDLFESKSVALSQVKKFQERSRVSGPVDILKESKEFIAAYNTDFKNLANR